MAPINGLQKWNKYKAQKVSVDGIVFDSRREAERYKELKLLQKMGVISDLQCQVCFQLAQVICGHDYVVKTPSGRCMCYFADFVYYDKAKKKTIVEDVKGMDTPVSMIKRAIVKMFYGIDVQIVK